MTLTELAARTSLGVREIRRLEAGTMSPDDSTVARLCLTLGLGPDVLSSNGELFRLQTDGVHFRARAATSKRDITAAVRQGETLANFLASLVAAGAHIPADRLSDFSEKVASRYVAPTELSVRDVEEIAVSLREEWSIGLGPIVNLVDLLESYGVAVFELGSMVASRIDAFSCAIEGGRPAIFLGCGGSASRRRFTVAHELGHLVLHAYNSDRDPGDRLLEDQANRFAGAFLMPAASFGNVPTFDPDPARMEELKRRWRTSLPALVMRAGQVGRMSRAQQERAFKQINAMYGRSEPWEPPAEHPSVLRQAMQLRSTRDQAEHLAHAAMVPRDIIDLLTEPLQNAPPIDGVVRASPADPASR